MNVSRPFAILAMLSLCACATPAPQLNTHHMALDRAISCCAKPGNFPIEPFPADAGQRIQVGPASPVFVFPSGKSFFRAYQLPDGAERIELEITTWGQVPGQISWAGAYVFMPSIMFLDANKSVTREKVDFLLYRRLAFMDNREYWVGRVKPLANERYFVIYTSPAMYDKTFHGATRYGRGTADVTGTNLTVIARGSAQPAYVGSPAGEIQIHLVK